MAIEYDMRSDKIVGTRLAELASYSTMYRHLLADSFGIDVSEIHFASNYLAAYVPSEEVNARLTIDEDLSDQERAYVFFFAAGCRILNKPQKGGYVVEDLQRMDSEQLSRVDGNSLQLRKDVDELIIGILDNRGSDVYAKGVSELKIFYENSEVERSLGMIEVLERQSRLGYFPRMHEILSEYTQDDLVLVQRMLY